MLSKCIWIIDWDWSFDWAKLSLEAGASSHNLGLPVMCAPPWLQGPAWVGRKRCGDEVLLGCLLLSSLPPASLTAGTLTSCMDLILGEEPAPPATGLLGRPGFSKSTGLGFRFVPTRDLGEEAPWMWSTAGVTFKKTWFKSHKQTHRQSSP